MLLPAEHLARSVDELPAPRGPPVRSMAEVDPADPPRLGVHTFVSAYPTRSRGRNLRSAPSTAAGKKP
jgi:hypothetical protein